MMTPHFDHRQLPSPLNPVKLLMFVILLVTYHYAPRLSERILRQKFSVMTVYRGESITKELFNLIVHRKRDAWL